MALRAGFFYMYTVRSSLPLSLSLALALALLGQTAHTQTATLIGAVVRDSLGHEVGGAQAFLPDLNRNTTANYLGAFKFDKLPAGRHLIVVRHIGFATLYDTIVVADGARLERDFILTQTAVALDSVRVTAASPRKYLSPGLQEFEERRLAGFGHFITEDVLRKNESSTLTNVIVSHMPGLKAMPGGRYVASTRKCGNGPAILGCGQYTALCPPTMYLNGALYYDPANDPTMRFVPDIARMQVNEYAAVEFYSGAATTPAKYNKTGADCGTLLLWTRER
jgi:hypothetical protein